MNKVVTTTLNVIGLLCILYYTICFYFNGKVSADQYVQWLIICSLIVVCLVIGVINSFKIDSLIKTNQNLEKLIVELKEENTQYHFSQLHQTQNVHETVLDVFNKEN